MTEQYHKMKLDELRDAEQRQQKAIMDYNIMMGILEDPEEEEEETTDE